jgi:hypothetical protein
MQVIAGSKLSSPFENHGIAVGVVAVEAVVVEMAVLML